MHPLFRSTFMRTLTWLAYLWARQSELKGGLESRLYAAVREWIKKEWPFKRVAYPGRDIDRAAWQNIPDEKR